MQIEFEERHTLRGLKLERNLFKRERAQSIRTFVDILPSLDGGERSEDAVREKCERILALLFLR